MDPRRATVPADAAGKVAAPAFIDLHAQGLNVGDHPMQVMIATKHYQNRTAKGDRR